jgi:beta-glucosidase-like glycosyl hydrolase
MKTNHRKKIAKEKMHLAMENFKQAVMEGAEILTPVTYSWAKGKIYKDRKMILKSKASKKDQEEAAEDACAASAQLLSIVREHSKASAIEIPHKSDLQEETDAESINKLINEGGIVL